MTVADVGIEKNMWRHTKRDIDTYRGIQRQS